METALVIIVLLVLLGLFGGVGYAFVRETGWENARLWLTSPRQRPGQDGPPGERPSEARASVTSPRTEPLPRRTETAAVAIDDTALRELREELHGELMRAAGLTREFDARLTRIETALAETRHLPEATERALREQDERVRRLLQRLRDEVSATKMAATPYGQRRAEALAELYGSLARVETALAGVINPVLLPGEPLTVPETLFDDTLVWENWNDVGDRAYAFGEVFNQTRVLLEPEIAGHIEHFIGTLRQALTGTIYPVLQGESRSPAQVAQVRRGLEAVVSALGPLRRELESAYRAQIAPPGGDEDDEDDDA